MTIKSVIKLGNQKLATPSLPVTNFGDRVSLDYGLVPRYKKIQYRGYDIDGNVITRIAEGFHARIIQHECDHLDGILFPSRIKDMKSFGFEDEMKDISVGIK